MPFVSAFWEKRRYAVKDDPDPPSRAFAVALHAKGDIWQNATIDTAVALRLLSTIAPSAKSHHKHRCCIATPHLIL